MNNKLKHDILSTVMSLKAQTELLKRVKLPAKAKKEVDAHMSKFSAKLLSLEVLLKDYFKEV